METKIRTRRTAGLAVVVVLLCVASAVAIAAIVTGSHERATLRDALSESKAALRADVAKAWTSLDLARENAARAREGAAYACGFVGGQHNVLATINGKYPPEPSVECAPYRLNAAAQGFHEGRSKP